MTLIFNMLAIVSAVLTGFLYWYGLSEGFLFHFAWYDIPIHLLGGLTFGLWGSALASARGLSPKRALLLMLALALTVGVMWEVFEYMAGLTRATGYWLDTGKDIADDLLGAAAVGLVYWRMNRSRKTNDE